jgi:organic hydroperoxide reductase OsmC/OhrA
MTNPAGSFRLHIDHLDGYEFKIDFDRPDLAALVVDEPPPLGHDRGPNPARLLAGAIGSCLSASLLFCMTRAKVSVKDLKSDVEVELVRNERQRLRLGRVKVTLYPQTEAGVDFNRCLEQFEDFCVVTQSVREGIDVEVEVKAGPDVAPRFQGAVAEAE